MKMVKKLVFSFLIVLVNFVFFNNYSFAQNDVPADVVTGGKAKCIITGGSPIKSGTTDGNRLVILEDSGFANGSIILQRFAETEELKIDANVLALFGLIEDLDGFLGGKLLKFSSSDSDISLLKEIKTKNTKVEVTNALKDGTKGNLSGKIQLKSISNDLTTGKISLVFENTVLKVTKGDNVEIKNNGKVTARCKFKDVPFVRKSPSP